MKRVYQVTFSRRCVTHEEADVTVVASSKREAMKLARIEVLDFDRLFDWHPQGDLHMERPAVRSVYLVPEDDE